MRNAAKFIVGVGLLVLAGMGGAASAAHAAGQLPDQKVCDDKANPPKDDVTKGGCAVLDRKRGNCWACHAIPGAPSAGNIGTRLENMPLRYPDKSRLRAQIEDASTSNPNTVMPPFGRHEILTKEEIDQVVEFLLTL
jgi:sulfur-oxidizing protein SoxX